MEKIINFLKENPIFFVATVDENKPKVRPFGFSMKYNERLYFGTAKEKQTYKQLMANPNVELCTFAKDKWIRISGVAVLDDSEETIAKAFDSNPELKQLVNPQTGLTPAMFYIKYGIAEIADMKGNIEKITF